jgi:hypothetical protein
MPGGGHMKISDIIDPMLYDDNINRPVYNRKTPKPAYRGHISHLSAPFGRGNISKALNWPNAAIIEHIYNYS